MRHWIVVVVLWVAIAFPLPSAQALPCRSIDRHQVCIEQIKRSAKNYWEYRVVVRVDGVKQPPEVYNCRDRTHTSKNGHPQSFETQDIGAVICRLFQRNGTISAANGSHSF